MSLGNSSKESNDQPQRGSCHSFRPIANSHDGVQFLCRVLNFAMALPRNSNVGDAVSAVSVAATGGGGSSLQKEAAMTARGGRYRQQRRMYDKRAAGGFVQDRAIQRLSVDSNEAPLGRIEEKKNKPRQEKVTQREKRFKPRKTRAGAML